jgi:hypothetical protein
VSSGVKRVITGMNVAAPEALRVLAAQPFDQLATIEQADAAPATGFNLVDGTVAMVTDPASPFVLFKGSNPDTWFFAPRWGRLAQGPDGEPAFMVSKKVHNNPDGSKTTIGGILSFMVELVTEPPDASDQQSWTTQIQSLYGLQPSSGAFDFQPLRLSPGTMDISGLDTYAAPGQVLKGINVGSSSSIGLAIELTPDGADHFAAMIGATPAPFPPQVAIMFTFSYQYILPQCLVQSSGYQKKCYDYFSVDAQARVSYFGLVNGSADYQSVRASLRESQAFDVSIIGTPPSGVNLQQLLDSLFDIFLKSDVGQWIQPNPTPANAGSPGGFFGGVSVAMKDVSLSASAQFNDQISFTGIQQGILQVSFNFEQQLGQFDPAKHLFIEEDDIKLPFVVDVSNCPLVGQVVVSASYTTSTGPMSIQCDAIQGAAGGQGKGTIQFTWPQKPTSAQISVVVDFQPPYGTGYIYTETKPVSDTGAAFLFQAGQFIQKTQIIFVMTLTTTDLTSKALFKWQWTPPAVTGEQRPVVSGFALIAPDPTGALLNAPTNEIEFPYRPTDYTGESTPPIQYQIQGLTGEWAGKLATGTIGISEVAMALDWDTASSTFGTLALPAMQPTS